MGVCDMENIFFRKERYGMNSGSAVPPWMLLLLLCLWGLCCNKFTGRQSDLVLRFALSRLMCILTLEA